MKLITNKARKNHRKRINDLILWAESIVICSGWMKQNGLKLLLPNLKKAIEKNVKITFFSNEIHTEIDAIKSLKELKHIKHVLIPKNKKTLHSKIHYFQKGNVFIAIVGSANITLGGLVKSEELSIEIEGDLNSDEHLQIRNYIDELQYIDL